jgi:hypothetical protein
MTQNWYNSSNIINLATLANPKTGWAGSSMPTSGSCQGGGGSNGWVTAKHCLSNLGGQPNVRFRFAFGAGTSCNNYDGMAFDDVKIENAIPNVANFSYGCTTSNLQYQFTNTSTLCPNSFVWNFGDPASGANNGTGVQSPTHTFTSAGTYTVTLTVSGPCNGSSTITKVISTIGMNISSTNLPCFNSLTGSINATVLNSTGTTNYILQPGNLSNTSGLFAGLNPGTFTISATDAIGCAVTSTTTITSSSPLVWTTLSATDISCNGLQDGKVTALVTGGSGSINYQLSPGPVNTSGIFNNLSAGIFTMTASDANGCSLTSTITIHEPTALSLLTAAIQNVLCHGSNTGSVNITYSGGTGALSYQLNPGSVTNANGVFSNLNAGSYTIICSDMNACSKTGVYTITEPPLLVMNTVSIAEPGCNPNNNGSATVDAVGGTAPLGYSIGGSFGSNNFFGSMTSNSYTVTVKDANGCTVSSLIILQSINAPLFTSVIEKDLTCADNIDGSIQVSATGNANIISYALSPGGFINGNGNFSSLAAGNYTITVTDADGCSSTSQSVILSPEKLRIDQLEYLNEGCGNESVSRLVCHVSGGTGAYTYYADPGGLIQNSATILNLGIGQYTIKVTDANLCSAVSSLVIQEKICCENVFLPNAFSPNRDGLNDEFALKGVNGIELKTFLIMNRWGQVVFDGQNLYDSWNGHFKGGDAEMGTYYYLVQYRCLATDKLYTLKGDLILIR